MYLGFMKSARKTGNPTVAAAYLRVSTDEQQLGPEAQRAAITAWATRAGITVASWHEDRLSGATPVEDRPGLLGALAALRADGAGLLVAAKRDRIARDVVVAATVERLAKDAGARVVTADGVSADDTPEGALMRTLLDAFAAYERSMIKARTRAALAAKKARGERYTRKAPLGWRHMDGRLVSEPGERAALDRIRGLRAAGLSVDRIVQQLNAAGETIRGGRWHATTIRRALRREAA
jgi:DNA invertase Pin-like site-specific DNA recombinase